MTDPDVVGFMWRQFAQLSDYTDHVVDTTTMQIDEALAFIRVGLEAGDFRLARPALG